MLGLGNKATTSKGQVTASDIPPIIALYDATDITDDSATISAALSSVPAATARGFEYDTNEDFSTKTVINLVSGPNPYSTELTGLTSNTVYYYRFFATNSVGTTTSAAKSFTSAKAAESELPSNSDWEVFLQYDLTAAVDGSGEVDGINVSPAYAVLASNQDGVTDDNGVSKDNCLLASKGLTDTDTNDAIIVTDIVAGVSASDRYKFEFDMFLPSTNTEHLGLSYMRFMGKIYTAAATPHWNDENGNTTFYSSAHQGEWRHIILDTIDDSPSNGSWNIRPSDPIDGSVGATSDGEMYLANMVIYKYIGS